VPIVSSVITEDRRQVDGRRSIIETHVDHVGAAVQVFYLAESDADVTATMAARVPLLEAQAIEQEASANDAEVLA
jgi:hypothetical protein